MRSRTFLFYPQLGFSLLLGALYLGMFYPLWSCSSYYWLGIDVLFFILLVFVLLVVLREAVATQFILQLNSKQRFINIAALGFLFVGLGVGGNYLLTYCFTPVFDLFLPFIGVKLAFWALLFGCTLEINQWFFISNNIEDSLAEEELEEYISDDNELDEPEEELIERITIKSGTKIKIIPIEQIVDIEASGDYVEIHTLGGKYLKEQTMKSLEAVLPRELFVRVHRSSIVNIEFIVQVEQYGKQSQILKLTNGKQVRVSASGYKRLKEVLQL